MSRVWRARDLQTGRLVALKILDKVKTDRLMARTYGGAKRPPEGEIATQLKHPNVVATFEHGLTTDDEQFLVMEFIDGLGLNFLIETRSPQLEGKRIDYLIQAAEGLAHVHEKGYIHRDVCPRNLLVSRDGEVKLIDFGLAVPNTPEFRQPGNRTGTASYMAPELIRRRPTDERIDVFSFAVTAYETITGRLPWVADETPEVAKLIMNTPPPDPREIRPDIEDDLAQLLLDGLSKDPRKRIPSMKEFAERLRGLKRKDY
jgi:serine/threonine protein kinase